MSGMVVNRIVTVFVALYWCAIFVMLATDPNMFLGAAALPVSDASWNETPPLAAPLATAFVLALASALVAVLFAWTFVAALFEGWRKGEGDADSIARNAFAAAAGLMTALVFYACYVDAEPTAMSWISLQVAALLASFSGVCAERRAVDRAKSDKPGQLNNSGMSDVQIMARQAAETDFLVDMLKPRLTGKETE